MSVNGPRPPLPGEDLRAIDTSTGSVDVVSYFGVYRSDTMGNPEDGYGGICVGCFGELEDAMQEARRLLIEGYHVHIDRGTMSQAEWDQLEEVPDDFLTRLPESTSEAGS